MFSLILYFGGKGRHRWSEIDWVECCKRAITICCGNKHSTGVTSQKSYYLICNVKAELQLPSLRVVEQSVPSTESSKFKRSCGDGKLGIFPFLKVNGMAGALRTKSQVEYDEARKIVKTQAVFILKREFESELRI